VLKIPEEESVRKLTEAVPKGWQDSLVDAESKANRVVVGGVPQGINGSQIKWMMKEIGDPIRVEAQTNGEWVVVWDVLEEENRCLRLDGHTWNWGDGPVPCSVQGRDFGLQEAKKAIKKEIERQESRASLRPKAKTAVERPAVEVTTEYIREVTVGQESPGGKGGGQKGGRGRGLAQAVQPPRTWPAPVPVHQPWPPALGEGEDGPPSGEDMEQRLPAPVNPALKPRWDDYGCFNCGSPDHWKGECPEPPSAEFLEYQRRVQEYQNRIQAGRGKGKGKGKGSYARPSWQPTMARGKAEGERPGVQSSQGLAGVRIPNPQEWTRQGGGQNGEQSGNNPK